MKIKNIKIGMKKKIENINTKKEKKIHKKFSDISGVFFKNPTIMCQLSIAPIVLMGVSLSNALALSLAMFLITTPTLIIFSFIGNKLKKQYLTMASLLISSLVYIPVGLLFKNYFHQNFELLGIFLPMLVINSIIIIKSRGLINKIKITQVFLDSLVYVSVFSVETCLISIVREIFGKNMMFEHELNLPVEFPALAMPFSGFILVGIFAAIMQAVHNASQKNK